MDRLGWDTIWKLGVTILIGMGVIVYISDFGPTGDDAFIPFGWDALVVALWSLFIYYWAMAVALPTEKIEEMIGEVELPEEGMEPAAH